MFKKILVEFLVLIGKARWYKVFRSIDDAEKSIPNQKAVVVDIAGRMVCLARNGDKFHAFDNICPHHQMPLDKGNFTAHGEWICPYHRHCFDLVTGKNKTMPHTAALSFVTQKINKQGVFLLSVNKKKNHDSSQSLESHRSP